MHFSRSPFIAFMTAMIGAPAPTGRRRFLAHVVVSPSISGIMMSIRTTMSGVRFDLADRIAPVVGPHVTHAEVFHDRRELR